MGVLLAFEGLLTLRILAGSLLTESVLLWLRPEPASTHDGRPGGCELDEEPIAALEAELARTGSCVGDDSFAELTLRRPSSFWLAVVACSLYRDLLAQSCQISRYQRRNGRRQLTELEHRCEQQQWQSRQLGVQQSLGRLAEFFLIGSGPRAVASS